MRPGFYLVREGSSEGCLDCALKNQAVDQGAKMRFKTAVPLDEADIVATGPSSANGLGVGVTFETEGEEIASTILDDRIAPKGRSRFMEKDTIPLNLHRNLWVKPVEVPTLSLSSCGVIVSEEEVSDTWYIYGIRDPPKML
jgi:hypothetical protein